MNIQITPSKLHGEVSVPSSKSICHRYLICNFIDKLKKYNDPKKITKADICANLKPEDLCADDVQATLNGLLAIANDAQAIDCQSSGSTARFLIPLVAVLGKKMIFKCNEDLKKRPFDVFINELNAHGTEIKLSENEDELLKTSGKLHPDKYTLSGNVSSQFASGLAMALCTFNQSSFLTIHPPIVSMPYLILTLKCINNQGFYIKTTPQNVLKINHKFIATSGLTIEISGKSPLGDIQEAFNTCNNYQNTILIEKDWSSAACWFVANYMGGNIDIKELTKKSLQGDSIIDEIMQDFGRTRTLTIDCTHIPDLVPYLAIAAAKRAQPTVLENVKRLKFKESNRIEAIMKMLENINISTALQKTPDEENLLVRGYANFAANIPSSDTKIFETFGDHRIVMASAILANSLPCQSIIKDADAVRKSYPNFWKDFASLGGIAEEV